MIPRFRATLLAGVLVASTSAARGDDAGPRTTFPEGLILIGAVRAEAPQTPTVELLSPTGEEISTLYRGKAPILSGRLSRGGDRLAFCSQPAGGKVTLWLLDATGQAEEIAEIADDHATITAWSPDGKRLAYYRPDARGQRHESMVIDLTTQQITRLELPADYIAEDWHPTQPLRTAIYMNPRNLLYRPKKGDHYPTRQLDSFTDDLKLQPITKNPSTDNIWARFSPDGKRLAHYGRRLSGEKSLEYVVVCNADGSQSKEIFSFTEFGDAAGIPWFRPLGPAAWSRDGSTLAWLVHSNSVAEALGQTLELLLTPAGGGAPTRISLSDMGFQWVTAVDWQ